MKLSIEEAENGFIVEEVPEIIIDKKPVLGKKYVFSGSEDMQKFITDFYANRTNKNSSKK